MNFFQILLLLVSWKIFEVRFEDAGIFGLPQTNDVIFYGFYFISLIWQMVNYIPKLCPVKPMDEYFISPWKYITRGIYFLAIYCKYNLKFLKFKDLILKPINQTYLATKEQRNCGAKYLGRRTKKIWLQNFDWMDPSE